MRLAALPPAWLSNLLIPALLLLALPITCQAVVYTLSAEGIRSLDYELSRPANLVKIPTRDGVIYEITVPTNQPWTSTSLSWTTAGQGLLTHIPTQAGDRFALQYTLLSAPTTSAKITVSAIINHSVGAGNGWVPSPKALGAGTNTVVSEVVTDQTSTTIVGSTMYTDDQFATWPANGGTVRVMVSPAPNATVFGPTQYVDGPPGPPGLSFYPVTPCRVADTRPGQGKTGQFGPPSLAAYSQRNFAITAAPCGIPASAQAFSLNMTVVPHGPLDFLSTWPTGQSFPGVSTLNSPGGTVLANAAIVPAGTSGSITVVAGSPTDLIIDVNGYFAPPGPGELVYYPVTPCRIMDTRPEQGKTGPFGPPAFAAYSGRDIPVRASTCGIPANAQAYALNMTAVPTGPLDFLSIWPAGQPYPTVSTLNSPDGSVIANAAIVPAGVNGAVTIVTGKATHVVMDINGYFAPPGALGSLHFNPVTPCRVADTRTSQPKTGVFGPPPLGAYAIRDLPIRWSACNVPATAQAYSLNLTVVPPGPLDFLSAWPAGRPFPTVSTLNAPSGRVIANAAIIPAGTNGAVSFVAGKPTELIVDVNGYFAP